MYQYCVLISKDTRIVTVSVYGLETIHISNTHIFRHRSKIQTLLTEAAVATWENEWGRLPWHKAILTFHHKTDHASLALEVLRPQ